jgi:hypothetical protein
MTDQPVQPEAPTRYDLDGDTFTPSPHGDYIMAEDFDRWVRASQERPLIDVDALGFYDLLDVAEAILAKAYPPHPLLCSHDPKADIGARTTAAIADLIATCRAGGSVASPEPD